MCLSAQFFIGSFDLSTKEPDTFMLCPLSLVLALALVLSSVHTSPWHRVRHRNLVFGVNMYTCPWYMHIKYLVILTYSFQMAAILVLFI